jgi:hypothetical protein
MWQPLLNRTPGRSARIGGVTPELLAALGTPEGVAALAAADEVAGGDPLVAAGALRGRGVPPQLAAAALTQAELRARAMAKFGPAAGRMFFTRAGLEQATRSVVALRRARRLHDAEVRELADLGCGIGSDALAAAALGIRVHAVDTDPLTAAVAAANARALGLADLVTVSCADATSVDLSTVDAVFCDPARRRGNTRVFDPRSFSPPWDFVVGLADAVPRTVLKLAPGIDHDLIPFGAEAEWVSVRGEVVEAAFWCGPLAEVPRRASLLPSGPPASWPLASAAARSTTTLPTAPLPAATLCGSGTRQAQVGPVRRYLYDPDGAVVRSHLVAEFADTVGGTLADPSIAYVFADAAVPTAFGRCFEVTEVLPIAVKRLRAALRERGVGRLTIKKRGSPLDPDQLRRQLRPAGPAEATLVLTRVAGAPTALLVAPAPSD